MALGPWFPVRVPCRTAFTYLTRTARDTSGSRSSGTAEDWQMGNAGAEAEAAAAAGGAAEDGPGAVAEARTAVGESRAGWG